jgi:GDP-mannose 6-dehydrogenase
MNASNIAVFGLGYVGCVSAACLAELGHRVTGVDRDRHKVQNVRDGRAPFYEPGLEEIVKSNVAAGRLRATDSAAEGIANSDVALVCVGTPSERNGNIGLEQLRRVVESIATELAKAPKPYVIAIRSTVFPSTCEEVVLPLVNTLPDVKVVSNPEFLREGSAVKDFRQPPLTVVGGPDRCAVEKVAGIYESLGVTPCLVTLRTAEMIKYACNAFHAVKISFANEIGAICDRLNIPAQEVMHTLCKDTTLNISTAYMRPGFAFGGSCLPKDLRAVNYRASRLDLKLPMLESVMNSNHEQLRRAMQRVEDLPGKIGIVGIAFKENTDDLRESPVVTLLEYLIGRGRDLRVWDPHIRLESIYGSNKEYILNSIPHIGRLLSSNIAELVNWGAESLVLTQKPSAELKAELAAAGKPVIDLSGWLEPCNS